MLVVRATTAADLPGLSALYATGFGRPLSAAEWQWKYLRLPGEARSLVALERGAVVAHAGAYALPARWSTGEGLAWHLADFVGRANGLRPAVIAAGQALLAGLPRPGDLACIVGFPSVRHLDLGRRVFGYRPLDPVVPWEGELPERARRPGEGEAKVESGDRAGDWAEAIWSSIGVAGVRRTAAFLNWRYWARPERYYRVYHLRAGCAQGLVVAAFIGDSAWLAELWLPAGVDWRSGLDEVAADLRASGMRRWRAWPLPAGTGLLAELGMVPLSERVPRGCRGGGAEGEALARSLYYAMGDHDLV